MWWMNTRCRSPCYTDRLLDNSRVWCTTLCWDEICIYEALLLTLSSIEHSDPNGDIFHHLLLTFLRDDEFALNLLVAMEKKDQNEEWKISSAPIRHGTGVLWKVYFCSNKQWQLSLSNKHAAKFFRQFPYKKEWGAFQRPIPGEGADSNQSFKVYSRFMRVSSNTTSFNETESYEVLLKECRKVFALKHVRSFCLTLGIMHIFLKQLSQKNWPKQPCSLCLPVGIDLCPL